MGNTLFCQSSFLNKPFAIFQPFSFWAMRKTNHYDNLLFSIDNVLDLDECEELIRRGEDIGFQEATVFSSVEGKELLAKVISV